MQLKSTIYFGSSYPIKKLLVNTPRPWFPLVGLGVMVLGGIIYFLTSSDYSPKSAEDNSSPPPKAPALPTETVSSNENLAPPHGIPSYQYNAQGQVQLITYPDGSTYTYRYDASGNKISETNGAGKTWTYIYAAHQNPITIVDPEGHITRKDPNSSER